MSRARISNGESWAPPLPEAKWNGTCGDDLCQHDEWTAQNKSGGDRWWRRSRRRRRSCNKDNTCLQCLCCFGDRDSAIDDSRRKSIFDG